MTSQSLMLIAIGILAIWGLGVFFWVSKKARKLPAQKEQMQAAKTEAPEEPAKLEEPPLTKPTAPAVPRPSEGTSVSSALRKTKQGWVSRLSAALTGSKDNKALFEEIEEIMFTADIGVKTTAKLLDMVKADFRSDNAEEIKKKVSDEITEILKSAQASPIHKNGTPGPKVVMFVGVNGVGKTTSIGKLAAQFTKDGHTVVLGAGDTFRAAASEQLEIWAGRSGAQIVRGKEQSDPSSVLFEAVSQAKTSHADFVLCDTAGRLHTKTNLMDELQKVHRVLGKACEGAPHEVLLVVDATTGQNAIEQARQFMAATPLSGVILTKLDGTAKGGVVIGIADELKIPIRYIGVGEGVADLRPFDADEFAKALFSDEDAHV